MEDNESPMFKVLIAETDVETIKVITRVIEEKIKDGHVVAVANSGREAVSETINCEPDLIIIAIRIAGMNGLEAIRQIRHVNKHVRIIIVSAYDYFEFAREAMLLNVNDYLLKPLRTEQLYEAVQREQDYIKGKQERLKKFQKEEHLLQDALRFVESSFMYSLLYNSKYDVEINQYIELLGIEETGYIMNIEITPVVISNYWDLGKAMERIYRRLKGIINEKTSCAVGSKIMNHIMIFVSSYNTRDTKEDQLEAIKLAKQIIKGLKDTFGLEVSIGIGSTKPIENIHESYLEALRCVKYKYEGQIIHSKEIRHKQPMIYDYGEQTKKLLDTIKYNKQDALDLFMTIIELLRPLPSMERINKLMEVLILVSFEAGKGQKGQDHFFEHFADMNDLLALTVEQQEAWAWRRFHSILKVIGMDKNDRKSNIINVALEYIGRHYNEELMLNDISEYVNLSPQHFSKIFKESTNYNYVEYVNNLRISKAKEFMNNTDRTIKEICYQVGYQDPNYFSRIFKKYVGITPTEYMKERAD